MAVEHIPTRRPDLELWEDETHKHGFEHLVTRHDGAHSIVLETLIYQVYADAFGRRYVLVDETAFADVLAMVGLAKLMPQPVPTERPLLGNRTGYVDFDVPSAAELGEIPTTT